MFDVSNILFSSGDSTDVQEAPDACQTLFPGQGHAILGPCTFSGSRGAPVNRLRLRLRQEGEAWPTKKGTDGTITPFPGVTVQIGGGAVEAHLCSHAQL